MRRGNRQSGGHRKGNLVGLALTATLAVASSNVVAQEVASKADFALSDSECGLRFTIANGNRRIEGSIAWRERDWSLRLPDGAFVVANGKLTDNASDVFDAILSRKGLAVGFYDGTILPIELIGLDTRPFVGCVGKQLGLGDPPTIR